MSSFFAHCFPSPVAFPARAEKLIFVASEAETELTAPTNCVTVYGGL
jgi:hypothetical protein